MNSKYKFQDPLLFGIPSTCFNINHAGRDSKSMDQRSSIEWRLKPILLTRQHDIFSSEFPFTPSWTVSEISAGRTAQKIPGNPLSLFFLFHVTSSERRSFVASRDSCWSLVGSRDCVKDPVVLPQWSRQVRLETLAQGWRINWYSSAIVWPRIGMHNFESMSLSNGAKFHECPL